ncbi:MAG: SelB C-terminal domain-containing protein, partial [Deltaproteobacteria bacterium]|nr:SelB C-terminal domain-containing protein [Deltaproteobacteria bacterium]
TDREDDEGVVASLVHSGGVAGVAGNELLGLSGLSAKRLDKALENLRNSRKIIRFDPVENRMVHSDYFELVSNKILSRLKGFHNEHPLKQGMSKQELRSTVPGNDKLFRKVLESLATSGQIAVDGDTVRSSSHTVQLKEDERGLTDKLLRLIVNGGNAPPVLKDIVATTGSDVKQIRNLLDILEKEGKIVRVKEDIYFSAGFIAETKNKMIEFFKREGGITPSRFSEITGSSRKYNIPLLEYFDRERFTIRVGDQRVLRGSGSSGEGGRAE